MALSIGIVGLPNVGKSTLFNALTNNEVLAANYPFATIDPNVGVVAVPDARLAKLAALYDGAPIVPATVTFVDIAGHRARRVEGEGLGNQFLAAIRESDAICQVVRVFHDDDVIHVDGRVDPESATSATVNTELILADLQTVENRLPKLAKEARAHPELKATRRRRGDRGARPQRGPHHLERGRPGEVDPASCYDLHLLTAKPFIYVFNVDEDALGDSELAARLAAERGAGASSIVLCAQIEAELARMSTRRRPGAPGELRPARVGTGAAGPRRLRHARAPDVPHRRAQGGAGLDHPHRRHGPQGGRA